jgi:hypothetical protein
MFVVTVWKKRPRPEGESIDTLRKWASSMRTARFADRSRSLEREPRAAGDATCPSSILREPDVLELLVRVVIGRGHVVLHLRPMHHAPCPPQARNASGLGRAHFLFGLNVARAPHPVRMTRHQGRDGCGAASASRLSRRRSFFFVPTTKRLLPSAIALLPVRPARVHGVGETDYTLVDGLTPLVIRGPVTNDPLPSVP